MRRPSIAIAICLGLTGCGGYGDTLPGDYVQAPGAGDSYVSTGPWGVGLHRVVAPARYTDAVAADVYFPSTSGGWVDSTGAPHPLVMLIQEKGQPGAAYEWLSLHLASWGMVVAVPQHINQDPSLASDNARWVRDEILGLSTTEGTWLSGGVDSPQSGLVRFHQEGDSIQTLDEDPDYVTVTLVGAEPRSPSTSLIAATVLLVAGSQECVADPTIGWSNYETTRTLARVSGMSHSQLTNTNVLGGLDAPSDCPDSDAVCDPLLCEATVDAATARQTTAGAVAAFHRKMLSGDAGGDLAVLAVDWPELDVEVATPTPGP